MSDDLALVATLRRNSRHVLICRESIRDLPLIASSRPRNVVHLQALKEVGSYLCTR
jgi:hypothetical protein